jgi:hypothetical protein
MMTVVWCPMLVVKCLKVDGTGVFRNDGIGYKVSKWREFYSEVLSRGYPKYLNFFPEKFNKAPFM